MVFFRRSSTPSSGRQPSNTPRRIFIPRFWSLSTPLDDKSTLLNDKSHPLDDNPPSPNPKPYIPRHAAADFSCNAVSDPSCIRQRHSVSLSICPEDNATLCSHNMRKKRNSVVVPARRASFVAQSNRESISFAPTNRNSAMFHNRNSIVYSSRRASRQMSPQSLAETSDDDYSHFLAQAEFRNQMQSRTSHRGSIQVVPVPPVRNDGRKGSVIAQRIVEYVRPPRQIC